MAIMRIATIATAPMMAGALSGEEELWSDSEVSMTSSSGFIVEVGSVIEMTLFGLTDSCRSDTLWVDSCSCGWD